MFDPPSLPPSDPSFVGAGPSNNGSQKRGKSRSCLVCGRVLDGEESEGMFSMGLIKNREEANQPDPNLMLYM